MNPSEYRTLYAVEDRHWWYAGMRRITLAVLESAYPGRTDLRILEAGSGTGAAMVYLSRFGAVTGCDLSPLALEFCRERGLAQTAQASVTALPYPDGRFDLVTSFDVLYHQAVDDYRAALREFQRVLVPGGRVLLRLPAYDWLRGHHDEVIHTARRFTAPQVSASLREAGFAVERAGYANMLLFPLALAKRLLERVRSPAGSDQSDIAPNPPWLDALLTPVLGAEAAWLRRRDLPVGLTVLAVGRKA
jgi:SAM-dependent methyltransferase